MNNPRENVYVEMNPALLWTRHVQDDEGACSVCNKVTEKKCTGCKTVYYCSTDHQKLHWKSCHKNNCGVIELVKDPQIGRHYIAKRMIEPGEIVLREKRPLVTFIQMGTTYPVCLNCYTDLSSQTVKLCNKCGWWTLCSNCSQHGAECEFTVKYGMFKDLPDKGKSARKYWVLQNNMVGVLRVLALREKNPKAYSKFLDHEDHCRETKAQFGDQYDTNIAKLVKKFFNLENVEETEMAKINRILLISGFGFKSECYFAEKTSYFEHNCRPNCSKTLPDKDGQFVVWAVKTIAPGEHVSISYIEAIIGTMLRKSKLYRSHYFECKCLRCQDPTDFGTMFNAVKCSASGCKGDMLPSTFTVSDENYPDFICHDCKVALPWKNVGIIQQEIGIELSTIQEDDVNGYKSFIEKHADTLHKNHFYMIDAKSKLADVLGFDACIALPSDVSIELLNEKIQLSEELCELFKIITPAATRRRGRLLYGIAKAYREKHMRAFVADNFAELSILKQKFETAITEAYKLMCLEPCPTTEEGQMAREAMNLFYEFTFFTS